MARSAGSAVGRSPSPSSPTEGRRARHARLLAALALVASAVPACAGVAGGGSSGGAPHRSTPLGLGDALSQAIERHGSALPYSVELVTLAGRASVEVGLFDGAAPIGVVYSVERGTMIDERPQPAVDDEEAASLADLRARLAAGEATLRAALRMVEGRYVVADVTGVALMVRGGRLLVRVVTGTGAATVEHLHDAVSGERASLPDAGPPDAGPPDAGPVDAGADAGPRDAGRRR